MTTSSSIFKTVFLKPLYSFYFLFLVSNLSFLLIKPNVLLSAECVSMNFVIIFRPKNRSSSPGVARPGVEPHNHLLQQEQRPAGQRGQLVLAAADGGPRSPHQTGGLHPPRGPHLHLRQSL